LREEDNEWVTDIDADFEVEIRISGPAENEIE